MRTKSERVGQKLTLLVDVETHSKALALAALYETSLSGLFVKLVNSLTTENAEVIEALKKARAKAKNLD